MNDEIYLEQELEKILHHLEYARKGVSYLRDNGVRMKNVEENLDFLIEDVKVRQSWLKDD